MDVIVASLPETFTSKQQVRPHVGKVQPWQLLKPSGFVHTTHMIVRLQGKQPWVPMVVNAETHETAEEILRAQLPKGTVIWPRLRTN